MQKEEHMDYTQYLKELTSKPIPKEMAFPESEYRRRAEKVRTFMDQKALDGVLSPRGTTSHSSRG